MRSYSFTRALVSLVILIIVMVLFPAVISFTAEYPDPLIKHYADHNSVYWEIRQISISPVFDEPETSLVELYFEKPDYLFIKSPGQQIIARGDTVWTYLIKHKQIQKTIGGEVFNPFDYIDTTQSLYQVVSASDGEVFLKSEDKNIEPDSLMIKFDPSGKIAELEYRDINENDVVMQFLAESFDKTMPADNFLTDKPADVEIIDLSDE